MQFVRQTLSFFTALIVLCLLQSCERDSVSSRDAESSTSKKITVEESASNQNEAESLADESWPETEAENTATEESDILQVEDAKVSLFDEFEFATLEEAKLEAQEPEPQKLYCLGEPELNQAMQSMIESSCLKISNRLASVTNSGCLAANLQPTQCASVKQFPILYSEFAPLENKIPQGRILVIGGTHGDELTSVSMIFRWIEKLNKYHSGLFHWHLVPMMNPDGVLRPDATRTNANGVDLNRNMPSNDWTQNALKYWREKTGEDERRYPGESASSEPETQWLIDEINTFKPDAIISVHAPYGIVDFDAQVLNYAPKNLGRLLLNFLGTYPGSLGNYAGINRDIPVITLELPHAWVMPSDAETTKLWEDIVAWLRKNINNPATAVTEKAVD
ncbi:MAG: murein peptide amidase A [Acidiferrobacterales bacterium]|nr:murein peptide amidase A [Acidiferrobacterales bacterium]